MTTNLIVGRGEDRILDVLIVDEDTELPINITDMDLWFYVKQKINDADALALIQKDTIAGIVIAPDQNTNKGVATVTIDAADTNRMVGTYLWGMQGRDVGGLTKDLGKGNFIVEADVVRA